MKDQEKLRISLFCGGRGSSTIAQALARHPQIQLNLILNAYDDGLSTGRLRGFVPGMLGPSDIRKVFSTLLPETDSRAAALKTLLEYRFPLSTSADRALADLEAFTSVSSKPTNWLFKTEFESLSVATASGLAQFSSAFLDYFHRQNRPFEFSDCSLGNLFFTGGFIVAGNDFNRAINLFCSLHPISSRILNVTGGEPLTLVALKTDGQTLLSEAEIVGRQSAVPIAELFLLKQPIVGKDAEEFTKLDFAAKSQFLRAHSVTPPINPKVKEVLEEAALVIYGPGTQHSSLLPSYLTEGLGEAIAANRQALKIFVSNVRVDNEIQGESVESLCDKLVSCMNRKGQLQLTVQDVVSKCFVQRAQASVPEESGSLRVRAASSVIPVEVLTEADWEEGRGVHSGGRVVDELISLVNQTVDKELRSFPYMVSIVVPVLNEERTVKRVLHDLVLLNFTDLGLAKEIICVDGGSADGTVEQVRTENSVRFFQLPHGTGRGQAIRHGIAQAKGNITCFYPSDGEYRTADLRSLILPIVQGEFKAVFGSRAIKCVNVSERIHKIYRGHWFGYWISRYGGMLLSVLSLVLYNRFLSDPLTGLKAFESRLLVGLGLKAHRVNLETEIIGRLGRQGVFILEVPVEYYPRSKREGKKTTVWQGLESLLTLFRLRWSS